MRKSWNTKLLKKHIEGLGKEKQSLLELINSLEKYVRIFRYHLEIARDAMNKIFSDEECQGAELDKLAFGLSSRLGDFWNAEIITEANVLGCIHSARAIFDVFAQLVNGLILTPPIPEKDCSISIVLAKLPDSPVKTAIADLISSDWYDYVNAFVNTAKHRTLVDLRGVVSFVQRSLFVRIPGFEYRGKSYPQYSLLDLLQGVIDTKNRLIDCGNELNKQVVGA
jgi:hypothetical protein